MAHETERPEVESAADAVQDCKQQLAGLQSETESNASELADARDALTDIAPGKVGEAARRVGELEAAGKALANASRAALDRLRDRSKAWGTLAQPGLVRERDAALEAVAVSLREALGKAKAAAAKVCRLEVKLSGLGSHGVNVKRPRPELLSERGVFVAAFDVATGAEVGVTVKLTRGIHYMARNAPVGIEPGITHQVGAVLVVPAATAELMAGRGEVERVEAVEA